MILPLRKAHRTIFCVLSVLLPAAFAAGITMRQQVPPAASIPPVLASQTNPYSQVLLTESNLWPGQQIITSFCRNTRGGIAAKLILRNLTEPDLLLYWTAGTGNNTQLPANSIFLGKVDDLTPLLIPTSEQGNTGRLILYSLANHEIAASSEVFSLPNTHSP